jgi:hypothetical protein
MYEAESIHRRCQLWIVKPCESEPTVCRAPAVDWSAEFAGSGPELGPTVRLSGIVRFSARQQLQVNRLGGRNVRTEEFAYDETDYDEGTRTTKRQWGSKELLSQELTLLGAGSLMPDRCRPFRSLSPHL